MRDATVGIKNRMKKRGLYAESPYPSLDEIDRAARTRLGSWLRYLPSPGHSAIGYENFGYVMALESAALDLITERFNHLGGWSPRVSKDADRLQLEAQSA